MLARNEPKTGTEAARQISKSKLNKLFDAGKRTKRETREISGTFGQMVGDAVENENLNRKAFSHARAFDGMSDEQLYDAWPAFLYYCDQRGIPDRAKKAPPLPIEKDGEGEEG